MNKELLQPMSDLQLLELVQERHSRASAYPRSKPMHDAWLEAKFEMERRLEEYAQLKTGTKEVGEPCFTDEDMRFIDDEYETDLSYRCKYDDIKNHLNTRANEYAKAYAKKCLEKAAENVTAYLKSDAGKEDPFLYARIRHILTDPKNLEV